MEGVIIAMLDLDLDIFQSFGHFSHKSHFFVGPLLDHFLIQFTTLGILELVGLLFRIVFISYLLETVV